MISFFLSLTDDLGRHLLGVRLRRRAARAAAAGAPRRSASRGVSERTTSLLEHFSFHFKAFKAFKGIFKGILKAFKGFFLVFLRLKPLKPQVGTPGRLNDYLEAESLIPLGSSARVVSCLSSSARTWCWTRQTACWTWALSHSSWP